MRRCLGAILLVGVVSLVSLLATARQRERPQPKRPAILAQHPSPDRRHLVQVNDQGRIRVDGHTVAGSGKLVGVVAWRRDSRAFAFLSRIGSGLQLVVVPDLCEAGQPLIWPLPPVSDGATQVFWISAQRVGVGPKPLVPRIVVSWTTALVQIPPFSIADNV
jgi:hypothetical protein